MNESVDAQLEISIEDTITISSTNSTTGSSITINPYNYSTTLPNPYQYHITDGTMNYGQSYTQDSIFTGDLKAADVHLDGDVFIKGKSLTDKLADIEHRLGILNMNPALESKWDELRELGNQYRNLEESLLKKENVWNILKK